MPTMISKFGKKVTPPTKEELKEDPRAGWGKKGTTGRKVADATKKAWGVANDPSQWKPHMEAEYKRLKSKYGLE